MRRAGKLVFDILESLQNTLAISRHLAIVIGARFISDGMTASAASNSSSVAEPPSDHRLLGPWNQVPTWLKTESRHCHSG